MCRKLGTHVEVLMFYKEKEPNKICILTKNKKGIRIIF